MIYYGRQHIDDWDVQRVLEVLQSDFLTQGPALERFEEALASYCGAQYAVAVTNATAALHIACIAAGLEPGDSLWTSPITFVASANCARYCGAKVDFVDIDSLTYNMSASALEDKLCQAKKNGKLPKIVVPVHFAGQPCEMVRIKALSEEYGFTVLTDASHALGADYCNDKVGSCKFADMEVFSFHPVKMITTGEGGAILTNDIKLRDKLRFYRNHGITRNPENMTHEPDGPWYYQQTALGFNYRMTDIQAALGSSQMHRLGEFVGRRRTLASQYHKLLGGLPIHVPYVIESANPSWHLYVVRVNFNAIGKSKRQIFDEMKKHGVALNVHYIPVHTQPYYERLGYKSSDFPAALAYYHEAMTLPLYYDLTYSQQKYVVTALKEVLQ